MLALYSISSSGFPKPWRIIRLKSSFIDNNWKRFIKLYSVKLYKVFNVNIWQLIGGYLLKFFIVRNFHDEIMVAFNAMLLKSQKWDCAIKAIVLSSFLLLTTDSRCWLRSIEAMMPSKAITILHWILICCLLYLEKHLLCHWKNQ